MGAGCACTADLVERGALQLRHDEGSLKTIGCAERRVPSASIHENHHPCNKGAVLGCVSFFCTQEGGGRIEEKRRGERRENERQEEQTGAKPTDASLVSAGLRDVLGMTRWREEHPKATWAEIEAMVDEQMNQLRAQLIQEVVQMGRPRDGTTCRQRSVPSAQPVASRW